MKPPILITGAARSGTSLIAGIIDICGAWGGPTLGPVPHNRKGQFEHRGIVTNIIKPYLRMQGYDPLGQRPLPQVKKLLPFDNLRQKIETTMKDDGYPGGPWYFKGAKMCLLWPVFHKAFPKAKWVIVRRSDMGIVHSCLRTGFMKGYTTETGWLTWVLAHRLRFEEMKNAGLDVKEVWPSRMFDDKYLVEIKKLVNWLGLEWKHKEVSEFISPALWHEKKEKKHGN